MRRPGAPCQKRYISGHKSGLESVATANGSCDTPRELCRRSANGRVDRFSDHKDTSELRLAARHLHKLESPVELYPPPEQGIAQIHSNAPPAPCNFLGASFSWIHSLCRSRSTFRLGRWNNRAPPGKYPPRGGIE